MQMEVNKFQSNDSLKDAFFWRKSTAILCWTPYFKFLHHQNFCKKNDNGIW
jgi:hypothetical protein